MPAPAVLVTLAQAKAHLNITLPEGDPGDTTLQEILDEAEATILDYLKDNADRVNWVDPISAPGPVTAAIKLTLGQFYVYRGDEREEATGPAFWARIDLLLARFHLTGIA